MRLISLIIFVVGALAAVASAVPRPDSPPVYGAPPPTYKQPGMPFEFAYAVQDDYSGNNYAHQQTSDGHVTSGSYSVALPDGRTEIVEFTADHDNGYVANVAYEGVALKNFPSGDEHKRDFLIQPRLHSSLSSSATNMSAKPGVPFSPGYALGDLGSDYAHVQTNGRSGSYNVPVYCGSDR
ncbi:cuticle protein 21-like [Penaeus chinensis]|uniref:cuticle protein 21-like n=1 Tax=Penaeus chinensis TaxID=139456 RepID=UPI001FB6806B|nr:cuticle protein 21-like [Penaeus chinensis]